MEVTLRIGKGKNGLCLDSRKGNEVTIKNAYPILNIDGILSRLPEATFITSLDLKDALWQILLHPDSQDKTAFRILCRPLYQYKAMPLHLDDLLIVSSTFERHLNKLALVAKQLRDAGLTLNVKKRKFCRKEVNYLDHVIENCVIQTNTEKISGIVNYLVPKSVKDIPRLIGMTCWYRKFVRNDVALAAPLTVLLKGKRIQKPSNRSMK